MSNSGIIYSARYADVAQLAEQLTCNQQVAGSSPIVGSSYTPAQTGVFSVRTGDSKTGTIRS